MVFRILNFSIFFCHCLVGVTEKSTSKLESFKLVENLRPGIRESMV